MNDSVWHRAAVPAVLGLQPYVPGKPAETLQRELGLKEVVKLASNENPLGPSPAALRAIVEVSRDLARYPDGAGWNLKAMLAEHLQVGREQITLGNGSNDVLEMIGRVFTGPGREAMYAQYAFAVYGLVTQAVGASHCVVPARAWGHDLEAMAAAVNPQTSLIYLANPNNPTGTCFSNEVLQRFLDAVPKHIPVVLDEAYFEYFEPDQRPDGMRLLTRHPNLIVCRTFSKAYGLAGLRVGYAVSHPEIADLLNRVRQPFNVSLPAQAAAIAALTDLDHLQRSIDLNRSGLGEFSKAMQDRQVHYIPSAGNFLSIQVGQHAAALNQSLLRKGVIVRPLAGYDMPEWLRVSIGLPHEMARFIEAFDAIRSGGEPD